MRKLFVFFWETGVSSSHERPLFKICAIMVCNRTLYRPLVFSRRLWCCATTSKYRVYLDPVYWLLLYMRYPSSPTVPVTHCSRLSPFAPTQNGGDPLEMLDARDTCYTHGLGEHHISMHSLYNKLSRKIEVP